MHLLNAQPGCFDEDGIVRFDQEPADMVILTCADTELTCLAKALDNLPTDFPSCRLANLTYLKNHASVDYYVDDILQHAKLIVVSLLGGESYWPYGVEQIIQLAQQHDIRYLFLPGDDHFDVNLVSRSNAEQGQCLTAWQYLREGGVQNGEGLLKYLAKQFLHLPYEVQSLRLFPKAGIYHAKRHSPSLQDWQAEWQPQQANVAILFYRNHVLSGNTEVFQELITSLQRQGLNALPLYINSLKDSTSREIIDSLCEQADIQLLLNTTGFALANMGSGARHDKAFSAQHFDLPVLQVILASNTQENWLQSTQGLQATDLAMNIALPEVDGRIITRAISFKDSKQLHAKAQSQLVAYSSHAEGIEWVAKLSHRYCELAKKDNAIKRIALILANYPNRDGRVGNGVGLDTPASVINILRAMQKTGYDLEDIPSDSQQLMQTLLGSVSNDTQWQALRYCYQSMSLQDYHGFFAQLPLENQQAVTQRWGAVEQDPMVRQGRIMIAGLRFGNVFVGIQPARGYQLDLKASYHDPDLVPPHYYLAFYFWLRHIFQIDAVAHVGKHGNLEWLPGKGVALGPNCWPDICLGPLPHIYPFIVNDPGEGTQAKRRNQAVIIDHLVPALTRAETYGELVKMECLVDEYYDAMLMDVRRARRIQADILSFIQQQNLHTELGWTSLPKDAEQQQQLFAQVDNYLCDLKEAQIRDGLHILGQSPKQQQRHDLIIALCRLPFYEKHQQRFGLLHSLAHDLGLPAEFDPLQSDNQTWTAARPQVLQDISADPWRHQGDTRERLEKLALKILQSFEQGESLTGYPLTLELLLHAQSHVIEKLDVCGEAEIKHLLSALNAHFVPPGPSGAPSRGRLDVLPTGRNFFSVDLRAIPSPTAWQLGFASAQALVQRHIQEHGDYPQRVGLSVWGTSTMRTGGDDIAQALALLGVQPVWAAGSNRTVDFKILPTSILDRPRVDVTLRVSGFFRDAFANVMAYFDAAVQAVAELDEDAETNPIRARIQSDSAWLQQQGLSEQEAMQQARWRVFGSKPGAYGAGLQGLIDQGHWQDQQDLAQAYVNWGAYAYGQHEQGTWAKTIFERRLQGLQVVLQNQDNREHDLLDSDDYYQFHGGMTAAVTSLSQKAPQVYFGDHANPAAPKMKSLQEEISKVIRSRVINPKWIEGVKRHGYKGAFEMAATVDYLYAYDATTHVVQDYQYNMVFDAYLGNEDNRQFLQDANPHALQEMAERFLEAHQRQLWCETEGRDLALQELILHLDEGFETAD